MVAILLTMGKEAELPLSA